MLLSDVQCKIVRNDITTNDRRKFAMAMMRCMNCMEEYNEKQNKCPHCGCVSVQSPEKEYYLQPETTLQRRYVVGNALRESESEIVYIGWDSVLEKRIAIKEFFPVSCAQRSFGQKELTCRLEEEKAQFVRGLEQFVSEAQQLAKFREDTGVIRIYDSFQENGTAYTIIEYTDNLRVQLTPGKSDSVSKWQQRKKFFYVGWGSGVVAILLLLVLVLMEAGGEAMATELNVIPNMVGMPYQQAEEEMETLGVEIEREKYCYSDTVETDVITCQSVPMGTKLEAGMVVKVVVTSAEKKATTSQKTDKDDIRENAEEDMQENTGEKATSEDVTTEEVSTTETSTASQSTQRTTRQTVKRTTQQTTKETTREKTTEKKTEKKTTEKKTTEKKTEKRTTEKKTEKKTTQEKTTEKATTEEVIVIED